MRPAPTSKRPGFMVKYAKLHDNESSYKWLVELAPRLRTIIINGWHLCCNATTHCSGKHNKIMETSSWQLRVLSQSKSSCNSPNCVWNWCWSNFALVDIYSFVSLWLFAGGGTQAYTGWTSTFAHQYSPAPYRRRSRWFLPTVQKSISKAWDWGFHVNTRFHPKSVW